MRENKKTIEEYRQRRQKRLDKKNNYSSDRMDSVEAFYERRNERRATKKLPEIKYTKSIDKRGNKWYNIDGREGRYDADDEINGEKVDWITVHGNHIAVNGKGSIVVGPKELKGKTVNEVKKQAQENSEKKSSEKAGSPQSGSRGSASELKKKEYTPSVNYLKYKDQAAKKIKGVFPENSAYATGTNYKGHNVPLRFQSKEAQEIFNRVQKQQNYTVDELKNSETVKQLDNISRKCTELLGGETILDKSPERQALRNEIKDRFMALGSARLNEKGKTEAFDGPVKREFKAVIYTGLPAVGKSSAVDPLSAKEGMFVFDNDTIKGMIPEFEATGGAAAGAVHEESSEIQTLCKKEFLKGGSRNGDNIAYPTIGDRFEKVMKTIKEFEDAGYTVEVRCLKGSPEISANRAIARAIETGRIIDSNVVLGYGEKPHNVYRQIEEYDKEHGTHYAAGMKDAV